MKSLSSALGKLSITTNSQKSKHPASSSAPRTAPQVSQNAHIHSNPATSQAMFVQDMGPSGDLQYNGAAHNHAIAFLERNAKADREKEIRHTGLLERSLQANNGRPRALRDIDKPAEGENVLEFPNSAGYLWVSDWSTKSNMSHQFVDVGIPSSMFNTILSTALETHKDWVRASKSSSLKNMIKNGWEESSTKEINKLLAKYNKQLASHKVPAKFTLAIDEINREFGYRVDFPTTQRQLNSWFKEYDDYKEQKPGWNRDLFSY